MIAAKLLGPLAAARGLGYHCRMKGLKRAVRFYGMVAARAWRETRSQWAKVYGLPAFGIAAATVLAAWIFIGWDRFLEELNSKALAIGGPILYLLLAYAAGCIYSVWKIHDENQKASEDTLSDLQAKLETVEAERDKLAGKNVDPNSLDHILRVTPNTSWHPQAGKFRISVRIGNKTDKDFCFGPLWFHVQDEDNPDSEPRIKSSIWNPVGIPKSDRCLKGSEMFEVATWENTPAIEDIIIKSIGATKLIAFIEIEHTNGNHKTPIDAKEVQRWIREGEHHTRRTSIEALKSLQDEANGLISMVQKTKNMALYQSARDLTIRAKHPIKYLDPERFAQMESEFPSGMEASTSISGLVRHIEVVKRAVDDVFSKFKPAEIA